MKIIKRLINSFVLVSPVLAGNLDMDKLNGDQEIDHDKLFVSSGFMSEKPIGNISVVRPGLTVQMISQGFAVAPTGTYTFNDKTKLILRGLSEFDFSNVTLQHVNSEFSSEIIVETSQVILSEFAEEAGNFKLWIQPKFGETASSTLNIFGEVVGVDLHADDELVWQSLSGVQTYIGILSGRGVIRLNGGAIAFLSTLSSFSGTFLISNNVAFNNVGQVNEAVLSESSSLSVFVGSAQVGKIRSLSNDARVRSILDPEASPEASAMLTISELDLTDGGVTLNPRENATIVVQKFTLGSDGKLTINGPGTVKFVEKPPAAVEVDLVEGTID